MKRKSMMGAASLVTVPVLTAGKSLAAFKKVNADPAEPAAATSERTAMQSRANVPPWCAVAMPTRTRCSSSWRRACSRLLGSQPSDAKRQGGVATASKAAKEKFAPGSILAHARTLAGGRADLLALAEDVAESGSRGATARPRRWGEVVLSGASDRYRVTFDGNEPTAVAAQLTLRRRCAVGTVC